MKVLFCKISCMKYYKGASDKDIPYNGGSFVDENGYGHEENNFNAVEDKDGNFYCLGFVETKSSRSGKSNKLHIERIAECEHLKNHEFADDVLVIWCATTDLNETSIVGWYNHATVYRDYCCTTVDGYEQYYNIFANKKDCVHLPYTDRHMYKWQAPASKRKGFGFGQSLVWFPTDEKGAAYAEEKANLINTYKGENWIDVFPE